MHPNPAFRSESRDQNLAFASERGFGVLSVNGPDWPLMAHVPFFLDPAGNFADLHLVRSNPIARSVKTPAKARIAVSGPDGYVSPDWYGIDDQVPTWNYVAVHLSGMLHPLPDDELPAILDRLSARFEAQLEPKAPWTRAKMDSDVFGKMLRAIQPFRFEIETVEGTWKLSQNKPDAVRTSAARHMEAFGRGAEPHVLAALMQSSMTGKKP